MFERYQTKKQEKQPCIIFHFFPSGPDTLHYHSWFFFLSCYWMGDCSALLGCISLLELSLPFKKEIDNATFRFVKNRNFQQVTTILPIFPSCHLMLFQAFADPHINVALSRYRYRNLQSPL